ncbi:MAG: PocR ligand-binding domain-containing protein [Acutalibacteraceae bacterium]|nr:PocR ligand-binding domain-containing protein [Acutalibacteraceae bacterium]
MDCIFDKNKIQKAINDFYISTGIAVTLYDYLKEPIASSNTYCSFCQYVRTGKSCKLDCWMSDKFHIEEVANKNSRRYYRCHAGLMEVITPIYCDGVIIAYMQIGQFRDAEGVYSTEKHILETAEKYSLRKEYLLKLYGNTIQVDGKRLEALLDIMDIIIKSFWNEGMIYNKKSLLNIKIDNYITEHIGEKISIVQLEKEFFSSKNGLYEFFRKQYGKTAGEYILQKRLQLAQKLLCEHKEKTITEIAFLCGFSDYNYFIRVFKKNIGITPLKYKKDI